MISKWKKKTHTQQNVGYDFPVNEIFMHFLNWWVLLCVKCFIIFRSSEVWFDDVDPEDLEQVTGKRMRLTSEDVDSTCNETLVTGNFEGLVFWYLSSLLFTWPRSRKEWSFFLRQHTFTHQLPLITCVRPISLVPIYVMPSVSIPKGGRGAGGGGTLDFKWQGWLKDFLGVEIFDFEIILGRKICTSIFLGGSLV